MPHTQPLLRQPLLRSGPPTAVAALLALGLAGGPAHAGPGISVSASGSTVSVTTSTCTLVDGSWGTASLLSRGQANFSQGRQVALTGTNISQSAAWQSVRPGTYTVIVVCSNNITAGTQSVVVSGRSTPTISATSSPSHGVKGGLGGGSKDYGPLTFAVGGALVGAAMIATGWVLRRRSKPYRL
ncbi:hypothetical protein RKE30_18325 [Streptomyces sp. Li-HN-5-11]|uniref:hypothetical protein n=1 Tax=Streptomyces sp. Li-HN-5-11 TaxID=3075432 RepID=UPI0028AE4462|nr:hypothetical protein [Streptomyces sp. Li-HN-5-11]WNM32223.1 hypothetical protein RKE30_18325 [Streptomyces sp. Li-HN-5-11]WOP39013.1 hypothetical protein RKE32_37255 [Streptomyces sp. Li-HN-5-13]